jgi:hypothetical protein
VNVDSLYVAYSCSMQCNTILVECRRVLLTNIVRSLMFETHSVSVCNALACNWPLLLLLLVAAVNVVN